jgi:hypothetical protein
MGGGAAHLSYAVFVRTGCWGLTLALLPVVRRATPESRFNSAISRPAAGDSAAGDTIAGEPEGERTISSFPWHKSP